MQTSSAPVPRRDKPSPRAIYRSQVEPMPLLVAKDEIRWLTQAREPDRTVDVFLLLGCGARGIPHIFLDSVAVFEALGIRFVAGAGQQFCCGNPYRPDRTDAADRIAAHSIDRMTSWGAKALVHWCTACHITFTAWSGGADQVWTGGQVAPMQARKAPQDSVENFHVHDFIERRLRQLGDRVPWKKTLRRRVLVEGHPELTDIHDAAMTSGGRMLSLVPGVEVLGYVEAPKRFARPGGNCNSALTELDVHDVQKIRHELAEQAQARDVDTISCQHHNCHRTWSRFASERLRVQQCVSIVAEALGVGHPDRYQTLALLGDTEAIVDRAEPSWSTWGLDRNEAADLAGRVFDPKYAAEPSCACGGDISKCTEASIVSVSSLVRPMTE
jgi:hypothetical protein